MKHATELTLAHAHLLICRTDNIGDVVLTLPLAGYLKQRYPDITISFLCRAYAAPIVRLCEAVDHVIEVDRLTDAADWLRQSGIDTILFAKPNRALAQAAKKARIARRVGTSHRLFHWWTCNRLAHFSRVKSTLHEAQLNFALLRPLGIDIVPTLAQIPAWYRLSIARCDATLPADVNQKLSTANVNLILHPKSNGNGREWPIANYTALAAQLEESSVQCWITGSANEGKWIAQHAPDLLALPNVVNVCGVLDLSQLALLIDRCDGLIASGTGPLHLAAALGKLTIGLFPALKPIDAARWGALGTRAMSVTASSVCQACKDAAHCECMLAIRPEVIAAMVSKWSTEPK